MPGIGLGTAAIGIQARLKTPLSSLMSVVKLVTFVVLGRPELALTRHTDENAATREIKYPSLSGNTNQQQTIQVRDQCTA